MNGKEILGNCISLTRLLSGTRDLRFSWVILYDSYAGGMIIGKLFEGGHARDNICMPFRASIDGRAKRRPVNLELYCEARDA